MLSHDGIASCDRQVDRPDWRCTVIFECFESLGAARAFGCLSSEMSSSLLQPRISPVLGSGYHQSQQTNVFSVAGY